MLAGALGRLRADLNSVEPTRLSRYEGKLLQELDALHAFLTAIRAGQTEGVDLARGDAFLNIGLGPGPGDTRRLNCEKGDCPIKALGS